MFDEWCYIPNKIMHMSFFSGDTDELSNKQWTKKVSLKQMFEIYVILCYWGVLYYVIEVMLYHTHIFSVYYIIDIIWLPYHTST